jgi:nitrite reductase/ring-hydroxylating ferredoxin subunit
MSAPLCRLADLADPGSLGATVERNGKPLKIMIVRRGDRAYGWVNSCPHAWVPLDIEEGQFLDLFRTHILCANHGAQFDIESGYCVLGPCRGKRLEPFPVQVVDGAVVCAD